MIGDHAGQATVVRSTYPGVVEAIQRNWTYQRPDGEVDWDINRIHSELVWESDTESFVDPSPSNPARSENTAPLSEEAQAALDAIVATHLARRDDDQQ